MTPFADFLFFALLLYLAIPTIILGLFGRANGRWALIVTVAMLALQFYSLYPPLEVRPGRYVHELWMVLEYGAYQWLIAQALLRLKSRTAFWISLALAILPLAISKYVPIFSPQTNFGFFGISYVSFRALDVIFSIRDRVVTSVPPIRYFAFLFFFPTISSGPIDRFRRFSQDWLRTRTRSEFLGDLDHAIQRLFRGFLYKFIIATLIRTYWMDRVATGGGLHVLSYMYAYTFYLFFDFAGYSAFAISVSYLLGIRTPENFNLPFLSENIRDFWNRWHISLSFWFRDHIYMRFLLAAAKGKWFANKHTASYIGLYLTFGIMGIWHGWEWYYIVYGLYHATILSGYDYFARWNKSRNWFTGGLRWKIANILLTFHFVAFGLLLFSGRLASHPPPPHEELVEKLTCTEVSGYVWDQNRPNDPLKVDIYIDNYMEARIEAGDARDDLQERGYGNGRHGFHLALPPRIMDDRKHTVRAVTVDDARECAGPHIIICPKSEHPATPAPTPAPATPASTTPAPSTPAAATPALATPAPATPAAATPAPAAPPPAAPTATTPAPVAPLPQ
jgi:membrane protein involved in D-alanine export